MKFETLAIHAGQEPDPNNGAVMTPVYLTSAYIQDGVGKPRQRYEYSRPMNPTRKALQDCLAALEELSVALWVRCRRGRRRHTASASRGGDAISYKNHDGVVYLTP